MGLHIGYKCKCQQNLLYGAKTGMVQRSMGAPGFWPVCYFKTIIPDSQEYPFLPLQDANPTLSFGGFGVRAGATWARRPSEIMLWHI